MSTNAPTLPITTEQPLNTIVADYPQTLPILHRFGLDACCGGAIPLSSACEHHGLDLAQVLTALHAAIAEEQE